MKDGSMATRTTLPRRKRTVAPRRVRTAAAVGAAAARAVDRVLSSEEALALLLRRLEAAGWHTRPRTTALPLVVCGLSIARAADQHLGEVVVTAPREREPQARGDPTAFATVIDTSSAPSGVETLGEALAESVGVQVRRFGG